MKMHTAFVAINALLIVGSTAAFAEDKLSGTWGIQDRRNAPMVVDKAVTKVTDQMNFATRLLHKSFLENINQPCLVWKLALTETDFAWECYGHKSDKMPTDANQLVLTAENGKQVKDTFEQNEGEITTVVETDKVKRTNTWRVISDTHIEYKTLIESVDLPEPISWTLLYRRH